MPQPLKDATKDLLAEKIDKQTWSTASAPTRTTCSCPSNDPTPKATAA
ncbi:hypothetical protein [Streptomyces sp. NPDC088801]